LSGMPHRRTRRVSGSFAGGITTRWWPCLLTGYREMKLHEIDDRWEFDVELDAAQFLPAIPEDYQELTVSPAVKAQAAWCVAGAGLITPAVLAARRSRRHRRRAPVTAS